MHAMKLGHYFGESEFVVVTCFLDECKQILSVDSLILLYSYKSAVLYINWTQLFIRIQFILAWNLMECRDVHLYYGM